VRGKQKNMSKIMAAKSVQELDELSDTDFDITRTFTVLLAVLILPIYLALSVVSFSFGALV